jgi:glycosyltransferase involved in cell wall biosynthesis
MDDTLKLRILSQYFPPDVANTGQLLFELAVGFVGRQIDVEVLTALPTYGRKIEATRSEVLNGVKVTRVWSTRLDKNRPIGRILNSVTYFLSVFSHVLRSSSDDVLLIVSNPPFLPLVGYFLKRLRGKSYIWLVHDVYPEIAVKLGYLKEGGILSWIWDRMNRIVGAHAWRVIVLSDSMKQVFVQKLGLAGAKKEDEKIRVIHNWAREDFIAPIPRTKNEFLKFHNLADRFVVQYSGNLGLFQELEIVIEAARMMDDPGFCFLFIGEGGKKERLISLARKYNLDNVKFLPYQEYSMLPHSLTSASVAIVTLERDIEGLAMPSKLYTVLASGTPIVAFCDEGSDIRKIVLSAKCGFALRQDDLMGFVDILRSLKNDPRLLRELGANARRHFEEHYTFVHALDKYEELLKTLSRPGAPASLKK